MSRHSRDFGALPALFLALLVLAAGTSCSGGFLKTAMEGKDGSAWGGALAISPVAATLVVGATQQFKATGGDGSYSFSVLGKSGAFNSSSFTYTAPSLAGTERVRLVDGTGTLVEAVIAIKAAAAPDYRVAASPSPVFPVQVSGTTTFTGSFSIENISADAGVSPLSWKVYLARAAVLGPLDQLIVSGGLPALAGASVSSSIPYSGTWPTAAGNYFVIIDLIAPDDGNPANDRSVSAAIALSGAARPDYSVTAIAAPALGLSLTAFASQTLGIQNLSTAGPGGVAGTWAVYLSTDKVLDAQDIPIQSGTIAAGLPPGSSVAPSPSFAGSFPAAPGTYYFIATVSAFDDAGAAGTGTKVLASSPIIVSGPNYRVPSIVNPAQATTGAAMSGGFAVNNSSGTTAGSSPITWSVYASINDDTLDPGDSLIATGTQGALAAGTSSATIPYAGTWPAQAGSYFIIVRLQAADWAISDTPGAAAMSISGPGYTVSSPVLPTQSSAGSAMGGSFAITNTAVGSGSSAINWSVYASLANSTLDVGDSLIASGATPALVSATSSPAIHYAGTWPAQAGSYYILVRLQAPDWAATVTASATAVAVAGPSYAVAPGSFVAPTQTTVGAGLSGSFKVKNSGAGSGTGPVTWSVFASTVNTVGGGAQLIKSGSTPALGTGSISPRINYLGTWLAQAGSYYIIVTLSAADWAATDTPSASPIVISGPSYAVASMVAPLPGTAGGSCSGSFVAMNTAVGDGTGQIAWSVYASLANSTLDAGDSLIASGTSAALAAGVSSAAIPYSGLWPAVAGSYYVIVRLQATDSSTIGSLASAAVTVASPPSPDYSVSLASFPWTGVPGAALTTAPTLPSTLLIHNTLSNPGNYPIAWTVYQSADQILDVTDIALAWGSSPALPASGSVTISFNPAWSTSKPKGLYHLIATIHAADDGMVGSKIIVANHGSTLEDFAYAEGAEDNSGAGTLATSTTTSQTGAALASNTALVIEGLMDGLGANDTYAFATDSSVSNLGLQIQWQTGSNDLNLYVWDAAGTAIAASLDVAADAEPSVGALAVPGITAGTYYAGVQMFNTAGHVGQRYLMTIKATP